MTDPSETQTWLTKLHSAIADELMDQNAGLAPTDATDLAYNILLSVGPPPNYRPPVIDHPDAR